MAYADFSLESAEARFSVVTSFGNLFSNLSALPVPTWLNEYLVRGRSIAALVSEKARSEFMVTPILSACRDLITGELSIYSGQRLDIDEELGLMGECDYILALTSPVPRLRAPLVTVLEAKRGDIELGLGQCVAQMVGARLFNEQAGSTHKSMFGVVTTGESWQFLKLEGSTVTLHSEKLFIRNVGEILAALQTILTTGQAAS